MTLEKWNEINNKLLNKCNDDVCSLGTVTPYNWNEYKKNLNSWIDGMTEATEVYNMENTEKETK